MNEWWVYGILFTSDSALSSINSSTEPLSIWYLFCFLIHINTFVALAISNSYCFNISFLSSHSVIRGRIITNVFK